MKANIHFYHISLKFPRMKNVKDSSCRENQHIYFMVSVLSFIFRTIMSFFR